MRVTDSMIFERGSTGTARARSALDAAVEENSSGLRVQHPWDDPGAAGQLTSANLAAGRYTAIGQAAGKASDELQAADGALGEVQNLVARARELAVQLANGSYGAADRSAAAAEVDALIPQVIAQLNTRFGGRYLFGGNKDGAEPFDASGNYLGDTAVRQVEVAPGVLENASVRADVAFKGLGGGTDVLATLQSLSAALKANNVAGVQGTLSALEQGTQQISTARSGLGGSMAAFDSAVAAARSAHDREQTLVSHLADADPVESASKLALAQRALEASITATAQGFQLTLLDKLK